MPQYVFILGHNPKLSVAEIKAVLPQGKTVFENDSFLILELDEIPRLVPRQVGGLARDDNTSCQTLLNRLGGTVKIGQVISEQIKPEVIVDKLKKMTSKKLNFGISFYGSKPSQIGMEVKKELKRLSISSRLVVSRDKALSSVVVTKNKCIEFLVLGSDAPSPYPSPCLRRQAARGEGRNRQWLAQTCAVQEFEEYSRRDYGRPVRDLLSGSMPPKLAKIMINLARAPAGATILDPFCGSGTILQEGLLLGYKVVGSDISAKAIKDTKKNLEWLKSQIANRKSPIAGNYLQFAISNLHNIDVRELSRRIKQVDAIVTEPYLGPPLKGREDKLELRKIVSELSKLYLKAFGEFRKILSSGGKIVIIFPAFRLGKEILELPILEQIKKLGFAQLNKDKLIYSRPEQKVWRQIYIFKY